VFRGRLSAARVSVAQPELDPHDIQASLVGPLAQRASPDRRLWFSVGSLVSGQCVQGGWAN